MISKSDKRLLTETYNNASDAVETIYSVMGKVEDEELALDLTRQLGKFSSIQDRAEGAMMYHGEKINESSMKKVGRRWTAFRKSIGKSKPSHAADMLIRDNTKSLVATTKVLHDNINAKREYCELAEELTDFEMGNINRMKNYL